MQTKEVIANPTKENVSEFINTLSDREQLMFKAELHREGIMTSELEALFPDLKLEE